jgi:hypothetical protein
MTMAAVDRCRDEENPATSGYRKETYRVTAALPALMAGRTARENIAIEVTRGWTAD